MEHFEQIIDALPVVSSISTPPVHLHVEAVRKAGTTSTPNHTIEQSVRNYFKENPFIYKDVKITEFTDPVLQSNLKSIIITDTHSLIPDRRVGLNLSKCHLAVHVYYLNEDSATQEDLTEEDTAAASHWSLPNAEFDGLWESLVYDQPIKEELLRYTSTTILFSDRKVDQNIIGWNRVVLLHGPPGTGKTSLCKALAHKLCIQLSDRYQYGGQLIEINSHSLFSKWFSESGKLVMKMFSRIQEFIDEPQSLVCVLIDEVESLTAARRSVISGSEPSDAIRVVNAVLTQLDQIKKYPNVLILTTSNITGAIDLAFVDRADIKQFVGMPSPQAIYYIFQSCIEELQKAGIIIGKEDNIIDFESLALMKDNMATHLSFKLKFISEESEGLSGRTLRKLPFIAHAVYLQTATVRLESFLDALHSSVKRQFKERDQLTNF